MPRQLTPVVGIQSTFLEPSSIPLLSTAAAGTVPILTVGIQKRPRPTRSLSDWNAGSFVSGTLSAQWIQAPPFNSGGLTPTVLRATQKKTPTRPLADLVSGTVGIQAPQWIQAPRFNSGGLLPIQTQGTRRKNLSRPLSSVAGQIQSAQWLVAPQYNSGGIQPLTFKAVQKPRPTRGNSRWIPAPTFNSGGIQPLTLKAVQKTKATQLKPKVQPGLLGIQPTVLAAIQKKRPTRPNSLLDSSPPRWLPAPAFNSGGIIPLTVKAVQKKVPTRANSRFIVATPTIVLPGTPPIVLKGVQKTRPLHLLPKLLPGLLPVRPTVFRANQKPRPLRLPARIQPGVLYNSGGIKPLVLAAPRQAPIRSKLSRILIPAQLYIPVFIRPNPLAFPLQAQATAGTGAPVAFTLYGQGIYGISAYNQALVSVLAVPLQSNPIANRVV